MKSVYFFVILFSSLIITSSNCRAQAYTSSDLLNNTKQFDGKTITYKGEVIGDVMIRGNYAWLHVNDGSSAISIWAPKTLIEDIRYTGDYSKKGDSVEVFGTFHRSCLEHGGDLDIHASKIKKVDSGSPAIHPISRTKVYAGIYSLILVLLFSAIKNYSQKNLTKRANHTRKQPF